MKKQSPENSLSSPQLVTFDAIMPATMAVRAEESGGEEGFDRSDNLARAQCFGRRIHFFGAIFAILGRIAAQTRNDFTDSEQGIFEKELGI